MILRKLILSTLSLAIVNLAAAPSYASFVNDIDSNSDIHALQKHLGDLEDKHNTLVAQISAVLDYSTDAKVKLYVDHQEWDLVQTLAFFALGQIQYRGLDALSHALANKSESLKSTELAQLDAAADEAQADFMADMPNETVKEIAEVMLPKLKLQMSLNTFQFNVHPTLGVASPELLPEENKSRAAIAENNVLRPQVKNLEDGLATGNFEKLRATLSNPKVFSSRENLVLANEEIEGNLGAKRSAARESAERILTKQTKGFQRSGKEFKLLSKAGVLVTGLAAAALILEAYLIQHENNFWLSYELSRGGTPQSIFKGLVQKALINQLHISEAQLQLQALLDTKNTNTEPTHKLNGEEK